MAGKVPEEVKNAAKIVLDYMEKKTGGGERLRENARDVYECAIKRVLVGLTRG